MGTPAEEKHKSELKEHLRRFAAGEPLLNVVETAGWFWGSGSAARRAGR